MWTGVQLPKNHRLQSLGSLCVPQQLLISLLCRSTIGTSFQAFLFYLSLALSMVVKASMVCLSKTPVTLAPHRQFLRGSSSPSRGAALFLSRAVLASSRFLFVSRTASLLSRAVLTSLRFLFSISSIKDDIPRELLLLWAFTMFSLRAVFLPRPVDICLSYQFCFA